MSFSRLNVLGALCAAVIPATTVLGQVQTCPDPLSVGPDVIVGVVGANSVSGISNYAPVGGIDAFSVGTYSCNIGTVWLNWFDFNNQHPVIPQNLYRLKTVNGSARFEQIGMSWCKHGFFALSDNGICCTNCQGTNGQHLGVGCADPYTPGRNGQQAFVSGGLGPRFEINAHTGAFPYPYTHKDNTTGTGTSSISRRLQVALTDLDPAQNAGARYFFETQYVSPDDAANGNQNNNVSYREGAISGNGTDTTSTMQAFGTVRKVPAITVWKATDPTVTETVFDTPEATGPGPAFDTTGRAILSAKATNVGGGVWHYEYALYNMNSDRSFDGFTVPTPNVVAGSIGFHDVNYHSGDGFGSTPAAPVTFSGSDWPGAFIGSEIVWVMPVATPAGNSNALRWATTYNFRFDSTSPPTTGNVTVDLFKVAGALPGSVTVSTVVPTSSAPCPANIVNTGTSANIVDVDDLLAVISGWGNCPTPPAPCPANIVNTGTSVDKVDVDDLLAVIASWGPCS